MAPLPIVIGEKNPVLHTKTKPVKKITKTVLKLVDDMEETVALARGAGIAAPQVGSLERICLAFIGKKMVPLINPSITWKSEETDIAEEGCLSLPEVWLNIVRSTSIILAYESLDGKKRELKLQGFDARVVQHEVDHLDGILITDHRKNLVM